MDRTLARLRDHLGMDIAYISEVTDNDIFVRALCAPNVPDLPTETITLKRETGFCHYIINGEIPPIMHDVSAYPAVANLAMRTDFSIESFMGLPLARPDGSVYGTLCCISHETNATLNERDLETIKLFSELVAEQIDYELEDKRLDEERKGRVQAIFDRHLLQTKLQPITRLSDGGLKGFEALARFRTEPYLSPDKWFAEANLVGRGLDLEIEAIRVASACLSRLPASCSVSFNVSPECLISDELVNVLEPLTPSQIILELTEHAKVANYDVLAENIMKFKRRGYRIAIDDAGAGYSSLSHIVQLQPDLIKLDMSLTRDVDSDQARRSLANALVYFAKETKAEIVAEGIETQEEMETLRKLGVNFGQGYFFDRPMDVEDAARLAHEQMGARQAA
ncbi:MAG: EAL domain-containing protein [Pseudomonadota bacterium]